MGCQRRRDQYAGAARSAEHFQPFLPAIVREEERVERNDPLLLVLSSNSRLLSVFSVELLPACTLAIAPQTIEKTVSHVDFVRYDASNVIS